MSGKLTRLLLLCVVVVLTITGAAAYNRDNIHAFLYNITGEEELQHQVRGFPEWLLTVAR